MPLAGVRGARPREGEVLRACRLEPRHLRRGHLRRQPPGERLDDAGQRVQARAVQVGSAHALGPVAQVGQQRALRVVDPVVRLGLEHVVRPLGGADPRHHAGGEVRRRPVVDDRGLPLRTGQRVDEGVSARLVVRERRQRPVGGGHAAEHARRGGEVAPAGDREVERHVVPGKLPSPRRLPSRRPEDPQAVPLGVEQVGNRGRAEQRQRPPHVLHRHDRDDLRVPGHADRRRDQPMRELALRVGKSPDRQPVPRGLGQVRPLPPRPIQIKVAIQNGLLRLIQRPAERDRGGGHPCRGLRRQVLLHGPPRVVSISPPRIT